ncbi:hypothetical protein GCM10027578_28640 [Spirosoma luteolum]
MVFLRYLFCIILLLCSVPPFTAQAQTTAEICNNGIDDDGDNLIDCQDPDCPECIQTVTCNQPNIYYLPSIYGNPSAGNLQYGSQDLILSTRSANAIVTIRTPDGSYSQQVVLTSTASTSLTLPLSVVQSPNPNTKERNKGLIVQSDQPIQVAYRLTPQNNQDIISLKGRAGLGYAFYAGSQTRLSTTQNAVDQRHFVSIMATEPNTVVQIRSPVPLQGVTNPSNFTVSLNAGETYMVTSATTTTTSGTVTTTTSSNTSVAGLLVTSDKPIAVNSGSQHTYQPYSGNRDAGFDQLVPARVTGQQYVAVHGQNTAANSDYVFVVGIEKSTSLTITGPATANGPPTSLTTVTLEPGQVYTYNLTNSALNRAFQFAGNKKFYAYQVSSVSANEFGMSILPTITACTGSLRNDFSRNVGSTIEQALVVIPTAALSSLQLNSQPYTTRGSRRDSLVINGTPYSVVSFTATTAVPFSQFNTLTASQRFHVGVISGSGSTGNFGYYSNYDAPVDVLDPATSQPTRFYRAALVTPGQQKQHCLQLSSCSGTNFIQSVSGGGSTGSVTIDPTNNQCLLYTMRAGTPGCTKDTIRVTVTNNLGQTGSVCLEFVNASSDVKASIAPTSPIVCRPTGAVSLTASATGGTTPYSYQWITADQQLLTTRAISTTSTGQFKLTVTDALGCQDTTSIRVTGDTPAISFASGATTACNGSSLPYSLSSTAGTFSWTVTGGTIVSGGTPTSTTATINWTAASGTVRVSVTSTNGCTAITTRSVTVYSAPTLSTTAVQPTCFGASDGRITLGVTGGAPPYTYSWSNGATTQNLTNIRAGRYTVTVGSQCQSGSAVVRLSEPYPVLCPITTGRKIRR